ncbi:hypothetical protein BVRB_025860, partial [Beta vulgaris subsp. vulgaris]
PEFEPLSDCSEVVVIVSDDDEDAGVTEEKAEPLSKRATTIDLTAETSEDEKSISSADKHLERLSCPICLVRMKDMASSFCGHVVSSTSNIWVLPLITF